MCYSDFLAKTARFSQSSQVVTVDEGLLRRLRHIAKIGENHPVLCRQMHALGYSKLIDELSSLPLPELLSVMAYTMIIMGLLACFALQRLHAPYGRYSSLASPLYGFMLNGKLAWCLQELPSFVIPVFFLITRKEKMVVASVQFVLLSLFTLHYLHRCVFLGDYRTS